MAELLQVDYEMHKMTNDPLNLALRRYAGMALTNLTFGDVVNKVGGGDLGGGSAGSGGHGVTLTTLILPPGHAVLPAGLHGGHRGSAGL